MEKLIRDTPCMVYAIWREKNMNEHNKNVAALFWGIGFCHAIYFFFFFHSLYIFQRTWHIDVGTPAYVANISLGNIVKEVFKTNLIKAIPCILCWMTYPKAIVKKTCIRERSEQMRWLCCCVIIWTRYIRCEISGKLDCWTKNGKINRINIQMYDA